MMQYRLRTLLAVVLVSSLLSAGLSILIAHRSIEFQNYSAQVLDENLDAGRTVLVSIGADWSVNGEINRKMISSEMGYSLRSNRIAALEADWTRPSNELQKLMSGLGVKTVPAVAIFSPAARAAPVILTDLVDQDQVLQAIEQQRKQDDKSIDGP